jgi:hypothetical protein
LMRSALRDFSKRRLKIKGEDEGNVEKFLNLYSESSLGFPLKSFHDCERKIIKKPAKKFLLRFKEKFVRASLISFIIRLTYRRRRIGGKEE